MHLSGTTPYASNRPTPTRAGQASQGRPSSKDDAASQPAQATAGPERLGLLTEAKRVGIDMATASRADTNALRGMIEEAHQGLAEAFLRVQEMKILSWDWTEMAMPGQPPRDAEQLRGTIRAKRAQLVALINGVNEEVLRLDARIARLGLVAPMVTIEGDPEALRDWELREALSLSFLAQVTLERALRAAGHAPPEAAA